MELEKVTSGRTSQTDQDWQLTKKTVLERNSHMFNNPLMSDIAFTCGESNRKYFYAHKYVLATSSPVFCAMFYGDLADKSLVIHLPDTDEESFIEFLRFLYTDDCTLTIEIAVRVMYLAKKYIVPCLAEKCTSILHNGLNPLNVFTVLNQVTQFDEEELQKKCWEVVCSQTHEAVTSDNFTNVSKQTVENLLKQDALNIEEVELFEAVSKWSDRECSRKGLEASGENKKGILAESVNDIRFLSMTQKEFPHNVPSSGVLSDQDVVSVYNEFSGDTEVPSSTWRHSKRKPYFHRCSRFNHGGGLPVLDRFASLFEACVHHGLGFNVSEAVMFHGVRLLGCIDRPKITNFLVNSKKVKVELTYHPEEDVDGLPGFDVMLPEPILVNQDENVSLLAVLYPYSDELYYGQDGEESVTIEGATVTFYDIEVENKKNRTSVDGGQFHQILFHKLYNEN